MNLEAEMLTYAITKIKRRIWRKSKKETFGLDIVVPTLPSMKLKASPYADR